MLEMTMAAILLEDGQWAVSLADVAGKILFENRAAREMLGREQRPADSILTSLTAPDAWGDLVRKLEDAGSLADEPVLLQTPHGNAEICYVTLIPQFAPAGKLDRVLCVWATRRKALAPALCSTDTGGRAEYTHDLEQVLEHRAYQNLLMSEQNEFTRDALDVLPTGILVVSREGGILYRNSAMSDDFGLHPADYPLLDVRHVLSVELGAAFSRTIASAMRQFLFTKDPGGRPAAVDVLPLLRMDRTDKVLFQFSRTEGGTT